MPRNDDRFGAVGPAEQGDIAPQIAEKTSILDFVLPTEFVDLPTRGRFYPEEHPLHNKESVEIRYMTAKDTDLLTSKSLLKKGVAVDRMIQNILVDQSIKVEDLYSGDKNAIMIAARVNGFGAEYNTKVTCPNCNALCQHTFDLSEVEPKNQETDVKISENGTFEVALPTTKVTMVCRLLTGEDEQAVFKRNEKRKKRNLPEAGLTDQYKIFVVSINGETERRLVEKFIDLMPARDSTHLRKAYEGAVPNVDLKHDFSCPECDADVLVTIPFSAEFFWPDR